jgi:RHS repeat-associated protein
VQGVGEKFSPDLFTGTGNLSVTIPVSPGRNGFDPKLTLQYSTGQGNGPFGLGWRLSIPRVARKTEMGVPTYRNEDVFVLSGTEDLVPQTSTEQSEGNACDVLSGPGDNYRVARFRPRTESLFARIERWERSIDGDVHWRATTKDNVTSLYGYTPSARVCDPEERSRVFEWLLQETFDTKGNHIIYEYASDSADDSSSTTAEGGRNYSQRYLRRILYGNTPEGRDPQQRVGPVRIGTDHVEPRRVKERHYAFEVLFDYGDLPETPSVSFDWRNVAEDPKEWPVREDPFSTYRAGFEIRTLRRCRRILMLHHFDEGALSGAPLVKSTDLGYETDAYTKLSLLTWVLNAGYRRTPADPRAYVRATMPPLEFKYSAFEPLRQRYRPVSGQNDDLPPRSLGDRAIVLLDLQGDALPDFLQTTGTGHFYWRNQGAGTVSRRQVERHAPAGVSVGSPGIAVGDLGGDGLPDLVVTRPPTAGFYEACASGGWKSFRRFSTFPTVDLADPDVRLVDLTGDGLADILVTREDCFLWFLSKGEAGYAGPFRVPRKHNLDEFPDVRFSDPSGRVRLADMSGDGLSDIVLIHDGRVDYWPNLGHGRFGRRVTMAGAPRIGRGFDPRRLFLADLDGTGCADIVYVDFDRVHLWFNQSGNAWSDKHTINGTPYTSNLTSIGFADFYGTGTATLIWSYDAGHVSGSNYKTLDFCGGVKPYLLVESNNNLGATTRVQYASSTKFYLEDKARGLPWVTTLPFPVHVVEKTEVIDHIGQTKLVTTYRYHHGYFDGREREFRGFGCVDQWDTESFEVFTQNALHGARAVFRNDMRAFHLPPVLTKRWFHVGVYFDDNLASADGSPYDAEDMMRAYRAEFWRGDAAAFPAEDHLVEKGDAPHEAYRALRGALLRTEVFSLEGGEKEAQPFTVTTRRHQVKVLQPRLGASHAVLLPVSKEEVTYHYERDATDPRIAQRLVLAFDDFGNVTESVDVAYPRRRPSVPFVDADGSAIMGDDGKPIAPYAEQRAAKATYSRRRFINKIDVREAYFVGVVCETRDFEVHGLDWQWPTADALPTSPIRPYCDEDFAPIRDDEFVPYEDTPSAVGPCKRIVDWTRAYFRTDHDPLALDPVQERVHRLPFGEIEALGLPYESYRAAFTTGWLESTFESGVVTSELLRAGGYCAEPDVPDVPDVWWIPSGHQSFDPASFFLAGSAQDVFGNIATTEVDRYALLPVRMVDAVGNVTTARNDYRVLQPSEVTDPNGNSTEVAFDTLGLVVATAVKGKHGEGDRLDGFAADLTPDLVRDFFAAPLDSPQLLLAGATTRIVHDLHRFARDGRPVCVATLAREVHVADAGQTPATARDLQQRFVFSDGFGREVQVKVLSDLAEVAAQGAQWVASGTTVLNNKGKPVQRFEPFFSSSHEFGLEVHGVSTTVFYDPLGRVVCTISPAPRAAQDQRCYMYEKVQFTPWQQDSWDSNDTVLLRPQEDPDTAGYVGDFVRDIDQYGGGFATWYDLRIPDRARPPAAGRRTPEQDTALKTAKHAGTYTTNHADSLGRTFLTVRRNRSDGHDDLVATKVELDILGNQKAVIDPRMNRVLESVFDMGGRAFVTVSADAGKRKYWLDAANAPLELWDPDSRRISTTHDALRRPTEIWVTEGDRRFLAQRTTYGESADATGANARARVFRVLDGAGQVTHAYDFKGNLVSSVRLLANEYKETPDWTEPDRWLAGAESFESRTEYDALNRVQAAIAPDGSRHIAAYDKRGLLLRVGLQHRVGDANGSYEPCVLAIEYDAKGQRQSAQYANGVRTRYFHDPDTYRILRIETVCQSQNPSLQDLRFTTDPAGNFTRIEDGAFATVFNRNQEIEPANDYEYDALYRLVVASGREHEALGACNYGTGTLGGHAGFIKLTNQPVTNGRALRNYTERYSYDVAGNITEVRHSAGAGGSWTRTQTYEPSSNRLATSDAGCTGESAFRFPHDASGNIRAMPHLRSLLWDHAGNLREAELNTKTSGPDFDRAFYIYDSGAQRARKVIERGGARSEEQIYIGGFEIYRKFSGGQASFERKTLHVMDGERRVALVEEQTKPIGSTARGPALARIRYQHDNQVGSSVLELDYRGRPITYEEFYPYGGTAYVAAADKLDADQKRYEYAGKERDEETGLSYFGARYYTAWLGRWSSPDPAGLRDGTNVYAYVRDSPIGLRDVSGTQSRPSNEIANINFDSESARHGGDPDLPPSSNSPQPLLDLAESASDLAIGLGREASHIELQMQDRVTSLLDTPTPFPLLSGRKLTVGEYVNPVSLFYGLGEGLLNVRNDLNGLLGVAGVRIPAWIGFGYEVKALGLTFKALATENYVRREGATDISLPGILPNIRFSYRVDRLLLGRDRDLKIGLAAELSGGIGPFKVRGGTGWAWSSEAIIDELCYRALGSGSFALPPPSDTAGRLSISVADSIQLNIREYFGAAIRDRSNIETKFFGAVLRTDIFHSSQRIGSFGGSPDSFGAAEQAIYDMVSARINRWMLAPYGY